MAPGFEPKWSDTNPHSLRSLIFPPIFLAVVLAKMGNMVASKTSLQSFCVLRSDRYKCKSQCVTLENALNFLEFFIVKWRWHKFSRLLWKREVICGSHSVHGKHTSDADCQGEKGRTSDKEKHGAWNSGQISLAKGWLGVDHLQENWRKYFPFRQLSQKRNLSMVTK